MKGIVYLNGEFIPADQARISVMDYGFLFGYGIFTTMRVYNGKVFRIENHLERLENSARKLGIAIETPNLTQAIREIIRVNNHKEARLRLTISVGEGTPSPDPRSCTRPTILIISAPYIPGSQENYARGFSSIISTIRRNSQSPVTGLKTLNYLESLLARQEAKTADADEAILLNDKGTVAESSTGNVFLVSRGILKTPLVESGLIPGTVREIVLEMAPGLGIETEEADITVSELMSADEVFLTNSLIEIMPLVSISGKSIGSGKPGFITKRLMAAYKELVERETA